MFNLKPIPVALGSIVRNSTTFHKDCRKVNEMLKLAVNTLPRPQSWTFNQECANITIQGKIYARILQSGHGCALECRNTRRTNSTAKHNSDRSTE